MVAFASTLFNMANKRQETDAVPANGSLSTPALTMSKKNSAELEQAFEAARILLSIKGGDAEKAAEWKQDLEAAQTLDSLRGGDGENSEIPDPLLRHT
jgi:hypothetical protein